MNEEVSLLECLKNDLQYARRNRDSETVGVLSTFISEIAPSGNEKPMDNDSIKGAVEKWTNKIQESLETYDLSQEQKDKLINEMNILSDYLPNKLDRNDIKSEVEMIIQETNADLTDKKNFGMIMKQLKTKHGSSIDGNIAKDVVQERMGR